VMSVQGWNGEWIQTRGTMSSACQLPTGSFPCTSLSANSSIMLRSYSSDCVDTGPEFF
jgi:hypothetical protein